MCGTTKRSKGRQCPGMKSVIQVRAEYWPVCTVERVDEPVREFLSGAGRDLRIDVSGLTSAGWWTSCVFRADRDQVTHRGVAFFEFNPKTRKIRSARFFWNV